MSIYISVDPGIKKCGLLLADMQSGKVIEAGVASLNKFSDLVLFWNEMAMKAIRFLFGSFDEISVFDSSVVLMR